MTRHLVIGAAGLVGSHVAADAVSRGHDVISADVPQCDSDAPLDITIPGAAADLIRGLGPEVVSLPAGMTHVDRCESEPGASWRVNVAPVPEIIDACNDVGARLVYFSSDYVFDGRSGPYAEEVPVSPISVYGHHKVAAEHCIATHARHWAVVRTTVVYGTEHAGKNFVARLVRELSAGNEVLVPVDQIGTPTSARGLARVVGHLVDDHYGGVINVAGPDLMDRVEFARCAARTFGLPPEGIVPIETSQLRQPAPRPLRAGLETSRLRGLGYSPLMPSPREGLQQLRDEWSTTAGSA